MRPSPRTRGEGEALLRANHLEADIAFELVGRLLARMRIVLALAGLAQMAGDQHCAGGGVDLFLAALLDEDTRHRRLAVLGGEVLALPAVAAEPRIEEVAQQVGLVAVAA